MTNTATPLRSFIKIPAMAMGFVLVWLGSVGAAGPPPEEERVTPYVDPAMVPLEPAPAGWLAEIGQEILDAEYRITWQDRPAVEGLGAAWHAPNRAHGFRTYFTGDGIRVVHRSADTPVWEWGLSLSACGRGDLLLPVESASLSPDGNRMDYDRGGIREWYVNDRRGLEQAFTLPTPPAADAAPVHPGDGEPSLCGRRGSPPGEGVGADPVYLVLSLSGTLSARIAEDGRSTLFVTPEGRPAVRYAELRAWDALDRELPAWMEGFAEAGLRGIRIVVDDREAVYPLTVDPLATAPAWGAESNQASAFLGISAATAGDVNGDGYSDVIVGAHAYDNGQSNEGRAFVFLGSTSGLATTPSWTAESDQANALLGISVGTAGDVNGDGFSDVIVGSFQYDNGETDEGRVFVWHGSAAGLGANGIPANASWSAESNQGGAFLGRSVATAGDVNGDGFSDVIVGAPSYDNGQTDEGRVFVWHGSASGLGATGTPLNADWSAESNQGAGGTMDGANFGISVGTAGDVNGDGYADVIVGSNRYDNGQGNEGRVFVWLGSASGLGATGTPLNADWSAESNQPAAELGYSVGTAGDVNGDGYSDVLAGAYQYTNDAVNQDHEGQAFVWYGSASGLGASGDPTNAAWHAEGNQDSASFGISVGTAGDVNGDGYADVIVGAYFYDAGQTDEGRSYVYYGSSAGLSPSADWTTESDQGGANYGSSVATAGDVNGDGYSDVIAGARAWDGGETDEGRAFVYHGSPGGLSTSPGWTSEADQAGARFAFSVSDAGDVNGDGYADVIVGSPFYDNGQTDEGRAFVYHGSPSGLATSAAWTTESNQASAQYGAAVASAGDVNGDGYADVIVGAPFDDNGETDEGRALVYHGSPSGLATSAAWTTESNQASAQYGAAVASAGDVNGDGYSDIAVGAPFYDNGQTDEGRVFVYHGQAAGLSTSSARTFEIDQASALYGKALAPAGDVNRDGFSDLVAGCPQCDNGETDEGRAFVYHGSSSGLGATAAWTGEANQGSALLGSAVGTAGDVNGDGYADVVVGCPQCDNGQADEGRAFVWHGGASGLGATGTPANAAWSAESNQSSARLGSAVATAGDVNGDGYADVIVGASAWDGGETDEGGAFLYLGSATGLSPGVSWSGESNQPAAFYGSTLSNAGDVNGDGYADVVVGADLFDAAQADEGRAFVYYGNERRGLGLRPQQRRGDDTSPVGALGLALSPDRFRVAALGRTPFGAGRVKLQWEAKQLGTTFDGAGLQTGATWTATGAAGASLDELVTGLTVDKVYHWRLRLRYQPASLPFRPGSAWITVPSNGWQEADLRTVTPAGRVPRDTVLSGTMMSVSKATAGNITLTWAASCTPGDTDYEIYEGTVGGTFTSHISKFCSTTGATSMTFTPQAGSAYYLVVPRNASREGSYGRATGGERFRGTTACLPQAVAVCQ